MSNKNNRSYNFKAIFKNPDLKGFLHPNDYLNFIKNLETLKYLIFQWEINKSIKVETYEEKYNFNSFYNMYFEFKVYMSIGRIQKEFFNEMNVDIEIISFRKLFICFINN